MALMMWSNVKLWLENPDNIANVASAYGLFWSVPLNHRTMQEPLSVIWRGGMNMMMYRFGANFVTSVLPEQFRCVLIPLMMLSVISRVVHGDVTPLMHAMAAIKSSPEAIQVIEVSLE